MNGVQAPADAWQSAERIKAKWRSGAPANAAAVLREHPQLADHRSVVIDLAYTEYLQHVKNGAPPDASLFARGFPGVQDSVQDLIEAHRLLQMEPERLIPDAPWPTRGESLEGLEIRRELGAGAFGRAYLAFDSGIERHRVIKLAPGGKAEARMIGRLRHPHVIDVLWMRDVGIRTAVCMPFVGAETLTSVLERSKGTPSARCILDATRPRDDEQPATDAAPVVLSRDSDLVAAAAVAAKLARAVAYLHEKNVVHGDIKPSNVVLQPGGSPQVIDFNLAAGEEPAAAIRGTPAYMAPELVDAALANRRPALDGAKSDVFALGVTLSEWLTGRHPYRRLSDGTLASLAIAVRKPVPEASLPAALGTLLTRSLALDPAHRPSAVELADALDSFVHLARTRRRRRIRTAVAALATILVASLALMAVLRPKPEVERPPQTAAEYHERGLASLHNGKPAEARADFVAAHERGADPRDLALAAYCYSLTGEQPMALAMSKKAIDAGTDSAEIRNNRGAALLKTGKPDEAVKELDAALALSKDLRSAKYNRALARFTLALMPDGDKQLAAALADMDDVLKDGPFTAELHVDAARIHALASAKDPTFRDRAIDQLKAAVKLGSPPAKLGKEPIFKQHLAKDPRFAALIKEDARPVVPGVQLQFVEPFQK